MKQSQVKAFLSNDYTERALLAFKLDVINIDELKIALRSVLKEIK